MLNRKHCHHMGPMCHFRCSPGRLHAWPTEVATSAIEEHRLNSRNDPSLSNSLCQSRRCKPEIHVEASHTIWFRARRSAFAGPKINPGTGIARQLIVKHTHAGGPRPSHAVCQPHLRNICAPLLGSVRRNVACIVSTGEGRRCDGC